MSGVKIYISIQDSTLPYAQREVLLTGVAESLASELAQYYHSITVAVEDSSAATQDTFALHEISSVIAEPYFATYGGGAVY